MKTVYEVIAEVRPDLEVLDQASEADLRRVDLIVYLTMALDELRHKSLSPKRAAYLSFLLRDADCRIQLNKDEGVHELVLMIATWIQTLPDEQLPLRE